MMMPTSGGMGGLGFDNTADKGDEINLDELQKYIGGGGARF
jgi:hypothetical protein